MSLFENFPYTNLHNLNLDWLIQVAKDIYPKYMELDETISEGKQSINDTTNSGIEAVEGEVNAGLQAIRNLLSVSPTRNYIFIGDSYGTRTNFAGLNYYEYLKALAVVNADNSYFSASPGAGFVHPDPNNTFLALLTNLQVAYPEKITDIYIECGANDNFRDFNDLITALNNFRSYANNRFPLARLWLFACGLTMKPDAFRLRSDSTLAAFRQAGRQGFIYVMNSDSVLYNTAYLEPDRCHPNQQGVNAIAYALAMTIYTGFCYNKNQVYDEQANPTIAITGSLTPSSAIVGSTGVAIRTKSLNNFLTIGETADAIYVAFNLYNVTIGPSNRIVISLDNIAGLPSDNLIHYCKIRNAQADEPHEVTGTYEIGYNEETLKYTITIRPRGNISTGTAGNVLQIWIDDNIII